MEVRAGYKQTEVGVVPEDWQLSTLGEICLTSSGTTPSRSMVERYYRNGSIHWVKTLDLNDSEIINTNELVTNWAIEETSLRPYPVGTVLVAMYGGYNQIGRTGLLKISAAVNQAITAIQPQKNILLPEYLLATLNYKVEYWKSVASSSRKDPNITSQDVRAFPIGYPALPEQRAIATALSDVDALLTAQDKLIAKKRDIKQATMQQLLTGKQRLPGFSGEWEVKRLGDVGAFIKGSGVKKDEAQSGSLPCIRYGEIYTHHSNYIKQFNSWISTEVAATATRLKQGDVIFAGSGETKEEIGKCVAFVNSCEAYAGGDTVILRLMGTNPMFMGYYCNTAPIVAQKASKGQGDAVVHISATALSSIVIHLPSEDEQTAIAIVLSDMDAELAALEQQRDKTRAIKQGMMQELLTGRIRLV